MNKKNILYIVLIVVGALTIPIFLIGIPLMVAGTILLVAGYKLKTERWIKIFFFGTLAPLLLSGIIALILFFQKSFYNESIMELEILSFLLLFLASLISIALAIITLSHFKNINIKYKIMGLIFGVISVVSYYLSILSFFVWQTIAVTGLLILIYLSLIWRKRRKISKARKADILKNKPIESIKPPPLKKRPPKLKQVRIKKPKKPRTKKPSFGIMAWLLPLSGILFGIITFLLFCWEKSAYIAIFIPSAWATIPLIFALKTSSTVRNSILRILALLLSPILIFVLVSMLGSGNVNANNGYAVYLYLGIALIPPFIGWVVSPFLAIISLLRREKHPWLAIVVLLQSINSLVLIAINFVIKLFQ